jgi:hypothetical protein
MAEELGPEDIEAVTETAKSAGEAVGHALSGDWDKSADSALSMSETALGYATGGLSTAVEEGWDAVAKPAGLPSAHEALKYDAQAAGGAIGTGLEHLVGDDEAHKSAVAFDDGDILGGIGHMAQGAANTIGGAAEQGLSDLGSALDGLMGGGAPGGGAAAPDALTQPIDQVDDQAMSGQMPEDGGS